MTQAQQRNVIDLIWAQAAFSPTCPALILADRMIPYATLVRGALSVQGMIASLPIQRGQVIAILIDNPAKHIVVLLALMRAGYTTASIRLDQLSTAVQCGIQTVFTDVEFAAPAGVTRVNVDDKWFTDTPERQPAAHWPHDRVARIVFTSGSTGQPRPVAFSFAAVNNGIHDIGMYGVATHERLLTMHGLSSSGFKTALYSLAYGKTIAFAPTGATVSMIQNHALSCVRGSVAQARTLLLQAAAMQTNLRIATLVVGGAQLPWRFHDELAWAFRSDIVAVYSSTETGNIALARGALLHRRPTSGAYYYPTCEVHVVDENKKPLPPGKEGRLRVRAPSMGWPFNGHLTQSRQIVGDGWYYSGDFGRLEEDGTLLVIGRVDEIINDGGLKFNPEQMEDHLRGMDDLTDVAAVRMDIGGNASEPWAAVAATTNVTREQLNEWISKNVPGELGAVRFARVIPLDSIPRTGEGKIARNELRARIIEQVQKKA